MYCLFECWQVSPPFTSDSKAVRREGQQREEIIHRSSQWCSKALGAGEVALAPSPDFPQASAVAPGPHGLQNAGKGIQVGALKTLPYPWASRPTFCSLKLTMAFKLWGTYIGKLSHTCSAVCLGSFITVLSVFRVDFKKISKYPEREPPKGG